MRQSIPCVISLILAFFLITSVHAATVTFNFDASGPLYNSVFGFQVNYHLSDGSLLDSNALTIFYTQKFKSGSGIVPANGAVPGIDFSELGSAPSTDWDIGVQNNEPNGGVNAIVGYTLGSEPLVSGPIFSIEIPAGLTFIPEKWILSDATGDPGAFIMGRDFVPVFDLESGGFTISAVPIPATALLFLSGILGLVGIRKKLR